jgi:hypothetical protein
VVASNGIRVIRPFRLAFAWRAEPLRLGEELFGELAKLVGNRAGPDGRPYPVALGWYHWEALRIK